VISLETNSGQIDKRTTKFNYSRKWLNALKRRFRISKRRTVNRKMTLNEFIPVWKEWIPNFRAFLAKYKAPNADGALGFLTASKLFNVDESPFFLLNWIKCMNSSGSAVENKVDGMKNTVDISKRWCSLVITLRADNWSEKANGYTCKPIPICIIFRGTGTNMASEMARYDTNVQVFWQPKGWFDTTIADRFARFWISKRLQGEKDFQV
jgi:hypothetical protein